MHSVFSWFDFKKFTKPFFAPDEGIYGHGSAPGQSFALDTESDEARAFHIEDKRVFGNSSGADLPERKKENIMLGMGLLGTAHTLIGLAALFLGFGISLACGRISIRQDLGRIYIALTAFTSLTGFGIFEHGGFGKPHALGVLTLLTLAFAVAVELQCAYLVLFVVFCLCAWMQVRRLDRADLDAAPGARRHTLDPHLKGSHHE